MSLRELTERLTEFSRNDCDIDLSALFRVLHLIENVAAKETGDLAHEDLMLLRVTLEKSTISEFKWFYRFVGFPYLSLFIRCVQEEYLYVMAV